MESWNGRVYKKKKKKKKTSEIIQLNPDTINNWLQYTKM